MKLVVQCILRDLVAFAFVAIFFWFRWYVIPYVPFLSLLDYPMIMLWYCISILYCMTFASVDILSMLLCIAISAAHFFICYLSLSYYSSILGNVLVWIGIALGVWQTVKVFINNYTLYRFNPRSQEDEMN